MYGRQPITPIDAALRFDGFETIDDPSKYGQLAQKWLQEIRKIAYVRVNDNFEKEATYFDPKTRFVNYQAGDLVLLCWSPHLRDDDLQGKVQEKGLATKLTPVWHGPFLVMCCLSEVNYRIINIKKRKDVQIVHVQRQKPYLERTEEEEAEIHTPPTESFSQREEENEEPWEPETAPDQDPNFEEVNADVSALRRSQRKHPAPTIFP